MKTTIRMATTRCMMAYAHHCTRGRFFVEPGCCIIRDDTWNSDIAPFLDVKYRDLVSFITITILSHMIHLRMFSFRLRRRPEEREGYVDTSQTATYPHTLLSLQKSNLYFRKKPLAKFLYTVHN
jgi:hypothetical protein